jgi:hypothetical protein
MKFANSIFSHHMPQACTCAKTANVTTPDAGTMAPLPSANYLVRSTDCAGHRGIKNMTRLPFGRAPPPCLSTIGYSVWGLHIQKIHWHWRNRPSDDSALTIREIPVWRQDIVSPRDTLGFEEQGRFWAAEDTHTHMLILPQKFESTFHTSSPSPFSGFGF